MYLRLFCWHLVSWQPVRRDSILTTARGVALEAESRPYLYVLIIFYSVNLFIRAVLDLFRNQCQGREKNKPERGGSKSDLCVVIKTRTGVETWQSPWQIEPCLGFASMKKYWLYSERVFLTKSDGIWWISAGLGQLGPVGRWMARWCLRNLYCGSGRKVHQLLHRI